MNYPKEKRKENASISQLALEYYKKYGQNRDLQQYFVLSTPINLSREDIIEEEVPKIIVDEVVETGRLSSASSCVSDKRLEWDSGADVGYHNYYVKEKSSSLPSLSMVPGGESTPKTLTFQFLKDDENDITPILKKCGSKSLEDTRVISPVNLNQKSISEQSIIKNPLIENIFIVPLRNNYCSTQEMVEKQSDKSDVYFTAEDPDHESGSVESVTSESCSSGKSLGSILMASQYSTNLSKDLQSTIDVLKTIIDTKKYSSKDKKRLIKRIVKKIVNTDYDDDSTDDILKQNVPWTPVSFATTVTPNTKLEQTIEELGEVENDNPPPPLVERKSSSSVKTPELYSPVETKLSSMYSADCVQLDSYFNETTGNKTIESSSPVEEQPITWKEDITLSEKLFQERVKQIQEQRRKQKTPYTIQKFQTEILKHKFQEGDASQNKDFLEYTESQRKKQLEWVKSELYHLNQLKILLEEKKIEPPAIIPEERTVEVTSKGAIPKTVPVEVFSQQSSDNNLKEDTCSTGTEFSYSEIRSVGEYSDLINVQSKDRSVQTSPELKSQRSSNISCKSVQVEPVYIDTGVQVGTIRSDRTTKSRKTKTPDLSSPVERKLPLSVKTTELPSPIERKSSASVKTPDSRSPVERKSPPSVKTPELPSPVATKSPSMYSTKSVQVDSSFNDTTDQLTIQSNRSKSKSPEMLFTSPEIRTRTSSINPTKSVQPAVKLSDRTTKPPTGKSFPKSESQRISELASRVEQLDTALQNLQNKDSKSSSSSDNSLPESLKFFIEIDRKAHAKITRKLKHSEPMRISGGSSPDDLRHRVAEMLSRCDKCNNRTHCLCPEYKIIDPVAEKTRKNIENCGYSGNGCHCCGKRNSSYFLRVESRSDLVLEEKVDWEDKRGKKTTEQVNIFVPKMIKKGDFYEPNNIGTFVEYQGKKSAPLKDFLLLNRPKFVEDADKRRGYILDRMSERQLKSDIFKDHIRKTAPSDINRFNLELLRTQKFRSLPKKRFFTTKKMKDMTKKHYRKCTEVLEHKAGYKHRQDIKTNLFMKQLFAMKLQQNVRKGKLDHSFSKNVI